MQNQNSRINCLIFCFLALSNFISGIKKSSLVVITFFTSPKTVYLAKQVTFIHSCRKPGIKELTANGVEGLRFDSKADQIARSVAYSGMSTEKRYDNDRESPRSARCAKNALIRQRSASNQ